jgi:Flp pilus assembly pilin Flp
MVAMAILTGMEYLRQLLPSAHRDERGQDTLEWIMMSGLIAIAIVGVIGLFNGAVTAGFTQLRNCVDLTATTACGPTAF